MECSEEVLEQLFFLSSFLVLWENVFHIITYLFNLKQSAEVKYAENTAESENPKCHKSKELPLFANVFISTFSYRSKLTLIPTMVLKIIQFRDLTRNSTPVKWCF